jgi:hypothetical protein
MSKHHRNDEKVSPLIWLIPVPFVLAAFLPLTIDHPMPAKTERMAATSSDTEPAASAPARSAAE